MSLKHALPDAGRLTWSSNGIATVSCSRRSSISGASSKSIGTCWRRPPRSKRSSCLPSRLWASARSWGTRARTRCCRRCAAPKSCPIRPTCMALECARRLRRDPATVGASCDLASLRPRAGDSEAARVHGELPHLLPRVGGTRTAEPCISRGGRRRAHDDHAPRARSARAARLRVPRSPRHRAGTPKNAPRSATASSRGSDGRRRASPPRASVLQPRPAVSDRCAFDRRQRRFRSSTAAHSTGWRSSRPTAGPFTWRAASDRSSCPCCSDGSESRVTPQGVSHFFGRCPMTRHAHHCGRADTTTGLRVSMSLLRDANDRRADHQWRGGHYNDRAPGKTSVGRGAASHPVKLRLEPTGKRDGSASGESSPGSVI